MQAYIDAIISVILLLRLVRLVTGVGKVLQVGQEGLCKRRHGGGSRLEAESVPQSLRTGKQRGCIWYLRIQTAVHRVSQAG